jgi:V/A-type H+-transporting ATPase subunit F
LYKVIVITNSESTFGFQLAGVDVFKANEPSEARKLLIDFINDDQSGIIAIDEDLMEAIDDRLKNKIDKLYRPIVVPIPSKKKIDVGAERAAYVQSLIRRAVGFDIKLKSG